MRSVAVDDPIVSVRGWLLVDPYLSVSELRSFGHIKDQPEGLRYAVRHQVTMGA